MAKSRSSISPGSRPPRVVTRRQLLILGAVVFLVGGVWLVYLSREPQRLYAAAQREIDANPQQAAKLLEEAVFASGGSYPEAQLLWTQVLLKLNQRQEALGCFVLIKEPEHLSDVELISLAKAAHTAREPLLAEFAYAAVPVDSALYGEATVGLMEVLLQQGRPDRVLTLGNTLRATHARPAAATYFEAQAAQQLGNPAFAFNAYRNYIDTSGEVSLDRRQQALRQLVTLGLQLGEIPLAQKYQSELQTLTTPGPADRLNQAQLFRYEGNDDLAWELVNSLLESDNSNLLALELRASLAFDRGQDTECERDLRRLLDANPFHKKAHYQLAQVLHRTDRPLEAQQHFEENRALTEAATRILELQTAADTPQQETARVEELIELYQRLGQSKTAEAYRRQLAEPPQQR